MQTQNKKINPFFTKKHGEATNRRKEFPDNPTEPLIRKDDVMGLGQTKEEWERIIKNINTLNDERDDKTEVPVGETVDSIHDEEVSRVLMESLLGTSLENAADAAKQSMSEEDEIMNEQNVNNLMTEERKQWIMGVFANVKPLFESGDPEQIQMGFKNVIDNIKANYGEFKTEIEVLKSIVMPLLMDFLKGDFVAGVVKQHVSSTTDNHETLNKVSDLNHRVEHIESTLKKTESFKPTVNPNNQTEAVDNVKVNCSNDFTGWAERRRIERESKYRRAVQRGMNQFE